MTAASAIMLFGGSTSAPSRRAFPERLGPKGTLVYKLVTPTDHKTIGIMYIVACFATFFAGGLMALLMRTELAAPGLQFLSNEQFNQLFTMHGTIMLLLYATPIVFAGFITPGGAADFGWTAYAPLSNAIHSPGVGGDRPS